MLLFDIAPLDTKPKAMQNRKWMLEKVQRNVDTGLNPCKKLSAIKKGWTPGIFWNGYLSLEISCLVFSGDRIYLRRTKMVLRLDR